MNFLDYSLYITHHFLLIMKRLNNEALEERAKGALGIMVFMMTMLLLMIVHMACISYKRITYPKSLIFLIVMSVFFITRYLIFRRYKTNYREVVENMQAKCRYSNRRIVFSFLFLWFTPIFLFWFAGVIVDNLN